MNRNVRRLQAIASLVATVCVIWMAAPTYPMRWAYSPSGPWPTTWHSWLDPLVFGYDVYPPVIVLLVLASAIVGWVQFFLRRTGRFVVALCGIPAFITAVFGLLLGMNAIWLVPFVLLAAGAALFWAARRLAQRSPVYPAVDTSPVAVAG